LTTTEMAELRALSTRATITPNRFQNVYNFGDFKGDPLKVLTRYFDVHVYISNFGFQQLLFRVPRNSFDRAQASRYETDPCLQISTSGDYDIIAFNWEDEEGGGWIDDTDSEGWLPSLIPLRDELMADVLRSLYLAWLAAAGMGYLDDDVQEPPVPPGLRSLSASLQALAEFLGLDADLLTVAAARSDALIQEQLSPQALRSWIQRQPEIDKDEWLSRLIIGTEPPPAISRELLLRYRQEHPLPAAAPKDGGRTVAELLSTADSRAEVRHQAEADRVQRARNEVLDRLAAREEETWKSVEALIVSTRPANYDQAVATLTDLGELARREHNEASFTAHLREIRRRHAAKSSFLRRLERAGLRFE
jgi:hypothetical protein